MVLDSFHNDTLNQSPCRWARVASLKLCESKLLNQYSDPHLNVSLLSDHPA